MAGRVSRQILAEEAAKWSRTRRVAHEALMENIKSGGNGLTVRTVYSHFNKTVYIIQNSEITYNFITTISYKNWVPTLSHHKFTDCT